MLVDEGGVLEKADRFIEMMQGKVDPRYRQRYHLMAPVGWINDPNGFVFFQGYYHLFYQHYPYDSQWGPMHWGHARSRDLISWEHLPEALAPDQSYDSGGCFSGSAIEKEGKLFLVYTGCQEIDGVMHQQQCLAVSEDGIHFTKFTGNPIVGKKELGDQGFIQDFRDPKVFRHEDSYYMVVATKTADERGRILLFKSPDLFKWDFFSVLLEGQKNQGIMWECPDLFSLDGRDVLIISPIQMEKEGLSYHNISSTVAFIGEMDWQSGKLMVANYHELDFGLDFYAPQTMEDEQGRRLMVAWMQMWHRTLPTHDLGHHWAGSMTLPRELRVKKDRLIQKPVSTVYSKLVYQQGSENIRVTESPVVFRNVMEDTCYLHLVADLSQAEAFTIQLMRSQKEALLLNYDVFAQTFCLDRRGFGRPLTGSEAEPLNARKVHVPLVNGQLVLEVFRDTSSVEIFINGSQVMTATFYELEKGRDILFNSVGETIVNAFETAKVSS
ncbi:glycoside hydrolase family 32 protein [Enterococcus sp. AD013-P3]|uniref:glycoside hydrolase family 32 protein n=1 Tax=Enterococcus sp. AD013-P3 TaxID=3411036 RepID=UPI003B95B1E2